MDRRTFLGIGAAGALAAASTTLEGKIPSAIKDLAKDKSLKIKFMGTGAASGIGKKGLGRRHSSILVNDDFIIDFTDDSLDMIPEGLHPDTIFYTHSHKDHFQPSAALKIGVKKVYLSNTWYDVAVKAYRQAAEEAGAEMPEGQKVYITHMAKSLHPKNINETLPDPIRAAEDGLEVVFRAP